MTPPEWRRRRKKSPTYFISIRHGLLLKASTFLILFHILHSIRNNKPSDLRVCILVYIEPPHLLLLLFTPALPLLSSIQKHPHWEEDEKIVLRNSKGNLTFFGCLWNFQYSAVIVSYTLYIFICWGGGGLEGGRWRTRRLLSSRIKGSRTHLVGWSTAGPPRAHRWNNTPSNDSHIFWNLPFEIGLGRLFAGTWVASVCNFANVEDFNAGQGRVAGEKRLF